MTSYNWLFARQIKEIIGADENYTGEDARVKLINASVTRTLENLLGRTLSQNTYSEMINSKLNLKGYYDVYGYSQSGAAFEYKEVRYYLKNYPVDTTKPFQVQYSPAGIIDGSTVLETSDYTLDADNGILIVSRPTGAYIGGLTVTYTAGYAATTDTDNGVEYDENAQPAQEQALSNNIPADLVQAALWQAAHMYEKTQFSNINVRESRSQGSTSASRYVNINALAPEALAVIVQNKRRFFRSV